MSSDQVVSQNDQQHHIMKYFLDKLDNYAHKSHLWQLIHASHIRHNLMRKSRHISKIHSISEDLVRQSISQLLNDVDLYVNQLYEMLSSRETSDLLSAFKRSDKINTPLRAMQLNRARQLLQSDLMNPCKNDADLLESYYAYIDKKLTPQELNQNIPASQEIINDPFNLDSAYLKAENRAKEYLTTVLNKCGTHQYPNVALIDEMIKLGMEDMKKIPSKEDFQQTNSFLGRLSIFHKVKEAYQCILKNTGDDFMLLRFGRVLGKNGLRNTSQLNKQFIYLLHSFLKSMLVLLTSMSTSSKNTTLTCIEKIASLLFIDDDSSIIKLNCSILSLDTSVDQWTWLLEQWRNVLRTMPLVLTKAGAFSRVVRTTIGIGLIHLGKCAEMMVNTGTGSRNFEMMNQELFRALQIGFYFGIAYAVVDCLQDEIKHIDGPTLRSFLMNENEQDSSTSISETIDKWLLIMEKFLSGQDHSRDGLPHTPFTDVLIESFDKLLILTRSSNMISECFNELALLLRSQRVDQKSADAYYNNEELYLGSILKSHFTYTCSTHLGDMRSARAENDRIWSMPFLGQMTDDCRDFNEDLNSASVTPYTYYATLLTKKHSSAKELANPFYLFLNLCSDLYLTSHRDHATGAFLGRRIARTLRAIVVTKDERAFKRFLDLFCGDHSMLHDYFWNRLRKQFSHVTDPEKNFFRTLDSLSIKFSITNRKLETYVFENLTNLEKALDINSVNEAKLITREEDILISAMNYSVKAGGKRLRMLLLTMIGDLYGIESKKILPLACGIEYLHTSSLIFDDLPAQDNSDLRRGRPTLHKTVLNGDIPENLCEGRAQLAAVDLIAVSMSRINGGLLNEGFPSEKVTHVVSEIAQLMHSLCVGQMMDLCAARTGICSESSMINELDRIAWLKTGKTIEAVLVTPAILATSKSSDRTIEFDRLRDLSRLMGILFQMRDDLLDVESSDTIGKPQSLDIKNNTVTYVTLLGIDETRRRLQDFLNQTLQLVDDCWPTDAETIKDVVRHIVSRKS